MVHRKLLQLYGTVQPPTDALGSWPISNEQNAAAFTTPLPAMSLFDVLVFAVFQATEKDFADIHIAFRTAWLICMLILAENPFTMCTHYA